MVDAPRQNRLDPPIDAARDHLIGTLSAPITLVEYGSYACEHCHAAHEVVMASLLAACAGFVILRLSSAVQPVRLQADG